jgi:hypothetical protein
MFSIRLTTLGVAAAAAAAIALPAAAQATPCVLHLPGPGSDTWDLGAAGSLSSSFQQAGGSNFDAGHGQLFVDGVAYPAADACAATATAVSYPAKKMGGLIVSRSVSVAGPGEKLRQLDTIVNNTGHFTSIDVQYRIKVTASQRTVAVEGGGFEAGKHDHWAVLKNGGGSFPVLRWGTGDPGAYDATIVSDDPDSPAVWRPDGPMMPDATLDYESLPLAKGQTIRLLHVSDSALSQEAGVAAAEDRLTPFLGYSRATASTILNWGDDPDKDGVAKYQDDCPGTKGNAADGCIANVPPPPPVDDPPAPPDPPKTDDPKHPVVDTTAPKVTVTKLSRKVRRSKVGRLTPRVACSEACRIAVKVQVVRKGHAKAVTVLSTKPTPLSSTPRTVKLKVKRSRLHRLAKQRVSVRITARDAAGNARTVTRTVKLH